MLLPKKINITLIILSIAISIGIVIKLPINLGLDLQGGTHLILQAKETSKAKITPQAMQGVIEVIRNRIDALGVSEPVIQQKGHDQIIVELPGIDDPNRAIKVIGDTAQLEFVEAEWAPQNAINLTPEKLKLLAGEDAKLDKVVTYDKRGNIASEYPIILKKTILTGADLKDAFAGTDSFGKPLVNIEFNNEGAKKFRLATQKLVGKPIAIKLDNKIISAPNVKEPILNGRAQISGHFSVQEMRDLVIKLKAGALPIPVEVVYNKTVGPTLGKDSIAKSKVAGIVSLGVVMFFMIAVYQLAGFTASIALLLYLLFTFASLQALNATLTLPGIAGLILTIGMAVDANVIIFERIKEEKASGQTIISAIENGFSRAFITILDSNITTLISAIMLFWLGTGTIKGFAITLSLGIVMSMFTAVFITKLFYEELVKISSNNS